MEDLQEENIMQMVEASAIISEFYNCHIRYLVDDQQEIWLRAQDVASALGYSNTGQAVRNHVDNEDRLNFEEVSKVLKTSTLDEHPQTVYINKTGLICLVLSSKKEGAKAFKRWITSKVIPAILATGEYRVSDSSMVINKTLTHNQYTMHNEKDLHVRLVKFIREYYPHLILVPGLGEHQKTSQLRIDSYVKGYRRGQPDLLILNKHRKYNGLALELKNPGGTGRLAEDQYQFLKDLEQNNYLTLVCDKFEQAIMTIMNYSKELMFKCDKTGRYFNSLESLERHQRLMITGDAGDVVAN